MRLLLNSFDKMPPYLKYHDSLVKRFPNKDHNKTNSMSFFTLISIGINVYVLSNKLDRFLEVVLKS